MDRNLISVPSDWETESFGKKIATFRNDHRGIEVEVRAVYRGSKARKHGQEPTHYTVQLKQDWFSKGTLGDRKMAVKVDTGEEALSVAEEFMREFTREMKSVPTEKVQTVHASTGDHEIADGILTSESAAEAFADAAGYSDDLLLSVLDAETNEQYELVAHRDGATITTIAGDEAILGEMDLLTIHSITPFDNQGIKQVLGQELPIWIVTHLDEHTVYRFVFDNAKETDLVLGRGTEVLSPAFGRTIANVLEEKW
ncbi:hypothetical protein ACFR97_17040 [Haloplanus litoreus]|uniref:Uncharacterized protein n=1 Tax=Haloplanus litoreus TaxID=767515 RepID=A0ABD5ZYJ8_9EURY